MELSSNVFCTETGTVIYLFARETFLRSELELDAFVISLLIIRG